MSQNGSPGEITLGDGSRVAALQEKSDLTLPYSTRELCGAGERTRTVDIQLGKLTDHHAHSWANGQLQSVREFKLLRQQRIEGSRLEEDVYPHQDR
jgi:hypothetical protein